MAIGFDSVLANILTPGAYVEFDSSRASGGGVALQPHDSLLIGQKLAAGSAADATLVGPVRSADEAIALFGQGSQLAQMVAAYKGKDKLTPLYCIPLDDAAGTSAAGDIAFSGTATEGGELALYIGGRRVAVPVVVGDDGAALETAALAQLALEDDMPCTFAANGAGDSVVVTARHDGTIGNLILLGYSLLPSDKTPAGISVTITPMASGATDPDYDDAVTAMGEDQYHTIALGNHIGTEVAKIESELEDRWGPMRAIEGLAFYAAQGTQGALTTLGNARNSQIGVQVGYEASALCQLPWEVAARVAAVSAVQVQVDPARAYTGLDLGATYSAAPRGSRFTRAERDTLLSDGVATVLAGSDGRMRIERLVTTYQTNGLSIADTSMRDHYLVRTLAALRYSARVRITTKFARFKLADDGNEVAGQPIITPSGIRAELLMLFRDWQDLGWVENYAQFAEELIVERNGSDPNRVDALLPPDIINAFLVFAGKVSFYR